MPGPPRSPLARLLEEQGLLSPDQLAAAEEHRTERGLTFGEAVEDLGLLDAEELVFLLSARHGWPSLALDDFEPDLSILKILSPETARRLRVMPLSRSGAVLTVALDDPWNTRALDDVHVMTRYDVQPVVVSPGAMGRALERLYGPPGARPASATGPARASSAAGLLTREDLDGVKGLASVDFSLLFSSLEAPPPIPAGDRSGDLEEIEIHRLRSRELTPATRLVVLLLVEAMRRRASHVLVEPSREAVRVRLRVDGQLQELAAWPAPAPALLADGIKSRAGLNALDRLAPQRGVLGLRLTAADRVTDLRFRVRTLPTERGELLVLRRLEAGGEDLDLIALGFEPSPFERFRAAIHRPRGLVLVTGSKGSGRTRTLASMARMRNSPDVHILDASPAPELALPGVNHVVVALDRLRDPAGFLLAQSPDVLLCDDVPDHGWTGIVDAAVRSGCLLLATLDEPDTTAAVRALVGAGVPASALAEHLHAVVAQRLVRRLCPECRVDVTVTVSPETFLDAGFPPETWGTFPIFGAVGCPACRGTGYLGRVGLFEVMAPSETLRRSIASGTGELPLLRAALDDGMLTLRMSGLEKIRQGITTIEEVARHTDL